MADKVNFELVSPEKLLLSEEVDMVVVDRSPPTGIQAAFDEAGVEVISGDRTVEKSPPM